MIDGFKILRLATNINDLLNNELLQFQSKFIESTGEIVNNNPRISIYKGLTFIIKNSNVKLNGSLHKYWNNGEHNYNDYYFTDLQKTIFDLCTKFNINTNKTELNNLEFGVNIKVKQLPDKILKSIINYKGTPFQKFTLTGAKGIECIKNNFIIKIYDKSNQYKQPGNILRFEIKVIKMKYFSDKNIKINTLSDLLNIDELIKLKGILKACIDEILFYDNSINCNLLNTTEQLILSNGNNSRYWENLNPNSKDFINGNIDKEYISKRKKYYRELNKFKNLISKYSTSTIQKDLSLLIEKKCTELLNYDYKIVDKFPDYLQTEKYSESGQNYISYIERICTPPLINKTRICLTCKKDISNKKITAKFCCKKCKNDYTNPILNPKNNFLKRFYKLKNENLLFDISNYTILTEEQTELLLKRNTIQSYVLN